MSEIHLTKPSIREALVDFKFNFSQPVDLQKLESAHENIKNDYPIKEVMGSSSVFFNMKPGDKPQIQHTDGVVGYRFLNNKKDSIVQFRVDGFTFSKLEPYTSWEKVLEETQKLYEIYIGLVQVENVTRIATRYINFIPVLNENEINIEKYFNFFPSVPASIKTPIDNFLGRISFLDKTKNLVSIVNQGIVTEEKNVGEFKKFFLFDIDSYKQNLSVNKENPWDELKEIKECLNQLFFEGITDYTKEILK